MEISRYCSGRVQIIAFTSCWLQPPKSAVDLAVAALAFLSGANHFFGKAERNAVDGP